MWKFGRNYRSKTKLFAWGQCVSLRGPKIPGNSLAAIDLAFSLGFDGIELDIAMTKDGVPVLSHGEPVTDGESDVAIHRLTCDELSNFQRKDAPLSIVTLYDAFARANNRGSILLDARVQTASVSAIKAAATKAMFDESLLNISAYNLGIGAAFKAEMPRSHVVIKAYKALDEVSPLLFDSIGEAKLDGVMLFAPMSQEPALAPTRDIRKRGLSVVYYVHGGWPGNRTEAGDAAQIALQNMVDAEAYGILTTRSDLFESLTFP